MKDTLYTVRFLIGHDILARVLFLCRRDFEGRSKDAAGEEAAQRRRSFEPEMSSNQPILAVVSAGGIGQGGAEERASRASRVPPYPPASLKNRGLDSLKFASTIAFVPRAA